MDDPFRHLLWSSACATEASDVVVRKLDDAARVIHEQVLRSHAVIRDARALLERFTAAPGDPFMPCHVWRLRGPNAIPVDCTIQQMSPTTFRIVVASDTTDLITEEYSDRAAATARAQRLARELQGMGWLTGLVVEG